MNLGKKTEFFLFTLGKFYSLYNEKLKIDILQITVSKRIFIDLVKKASITALSDRMIYRHLETMEKRKLIRYEHRKILFTARGKKQFFRIRGRFDGYYRLGEILSQKDISRLCSKSQTVFAGKENGKSG